MQRIHKRFFPYHWNTDVATSVHNFALLTPPTSAKSRGLAPVRPLLTQFFAGPENRLVDFVCCGEESIAKRGNPLLLVGPSGSGKTALATHLSMKEAAHHERPKVVRLTAIDFARRYAEAVDSDDLEHFRQPLNNADVLLIDDVHLIADKGPAQEELAARLAFRTDQNRVTLLTCRRVPTEIRGFRTILSSRMLPGLMLAVALPGVETRRQILQQLALDAELTLPDDLIDLLAAGLPADIPTPRLAAAITHIRVWSRNAEAAPDVFAIQSALDATVVENEPSISEIAQAVARRFRLKTTDLKGPTRKQQVVRARALAMYLGRKLTERSLQQIGDYFGGRDHTTVLHACRKTESLLVDTPDLARAVDDVTETLRASGTSA